MRGNKQQKRGAESVSDGVSERGRKRREEREDAGHIHDEVIGVRALLADCSGTVQDCTSLYTQSRAGMKREQPAGTQRNVGAFCVFSTHHQYKHGFKAKCCCNLPEASRPKYD